MSEPHREDPYEAELAEGLGQDAVSKEENIDVVTARLVLKGLREREADWRRRVGDADYERAVAYWQAAVEEGHLSVDPLFSGDEEYADFLEDLYRSRREEL